MPSNIFNKLYEKKSYEHCKIIYYPKSSKNITQGVGLHKDGKLITFIFQKEQSRLEAFINGKWISIPSVENNIVVNIGKFLELTTNGYLKATIHRINLSPKECFNTAYFLRCNLIKTYLFLS